MRAPLLSRSHRRRRRIQFPIEIFFDGDGDKFFSGGWSEVGGNVLNDQIVVGSELVVNGDFANWTGDNPNNWDVIGEVGADPEVSEVGAGQGHGGGGNGLANLFSSAASLRLQQVVFTVGSWFILTFDLDTRTSGTLRIQDGATSFFVDYTSTGDKLLTGRAGNVALQVRIANADITIDNISVKLQTLTSLLNTFKSQFGLSDGFFIDIHINAVTADTQVGAIWNYDGSNNFGMAYMDGTNLLVDKNVNGTYTELACVGQAVTPDQILRIENPAGSNVLDILYNGVSKATPTIADASIIGNPGIALFSTEANNAISKVVIGKL
jgi:hypothetical protein